MSERILVGTRKGVFLATKSKGRWRARLAGHAGSGVNYVARDPSTGTLYQALHRLKDDGLIASVEAAERSDERRKYFKLTDRGRRAAQAEARRLHALVRTARKRKLYPQRA